MMTFALTADRETFHMVVMLVDREAGTFRRLSMHKNKSTDLRRVYAESAGELERFAAQLRAKLRGAANE